MKNIIIIAVFSITSLLMMSVSCVEHEVVPPPNNTMVNGKVVQSTQTNDYNDKIHFKGYFVEFQKAHILDMSVNLAFINILPIPGLDGGHALISIIEGI